MSQEIYEQLREQLDQYSIGFPATKSGVELKILKRLFSVEQAQLYIELALMLETPEAVAARTGRDPAQVGEMLEAMARKGLLFRKRKKDTVKYAAVAFVIGSYEFQLKNMDRELAEMVEAYMEEGFMELSTDNNITPLRTVPVHQSVALSNPVAPYSQAREIVKSKDKIALADCICRVQQGLIDKGCDKPREACLSFGSHADYYVENQLGRYISQEEALAVLDASEKAGLVNQPANMINPGGMCNCCGDCCGVLRALNKLPKPAEAVFNNYFADVNAELCTACEVCLERCQMAAITMDDNAVAAVNGDRCIGCGLCVTTCPAEAVTLLVKPEAQRIDPPSSGRELMTATANVRGTSVLPLSMSGK